MSILVEAIPALHDNYIWGMAMQDGCVIVDPGEAGPVVEYLHSKPVPCKNVLLTHHHYDHTGGVAELASIYPDITFIGPNLKHKPKWFKDITSHTDFHLSFLNTAVRVLHTPGHTLDHVCYYFPDLGYLFCGDVLFSAGCGRLLEGTPQQMFDSLQQIMSLPDNTILFPAHEYTLNNLRFAAYIEPNNPHIAEYKKKTDVKRLANQPSLPSTLALEKQINPFLRSHIPSVMDNAHRLSGDICDSALTTFTTLRKLKDQY